MPTETITNIEAVLSFGMFLGCMGMFLRIENPLTKLEVRIGMAMSGRRKVEQVVKK